MALSRPFRPTPGSLTSSPLVRGFSSPQLTLEYHPAPSPDLLGIVHATHPVSDVKESKPEDPAPPSYGRHAALQSQPAHAFYVAIRPESMAAGSGVLATWARGPPCAAQLTFVFCLHFKGDEMRRGLLHFHLFPSHPGLVRAFLMPQRISWGQGYSD